MISLALIAVGRDVCRKEKFRNPRILPSDQSIGTCLLRLFNSKLIIDYITTPGHTGGCCSLVITGEISFKDEKLSRIVLVGDLWDKENDLDFFESLSENPKLSKASREYILDTVRPDLIFPGHGPPFRP